MKINKTYRSLLDKSINSILSAIEIYNKPNFHYREETFAILAINAWELLLKAYILRLHQYKLRSILELQAKINKDGSKSKRRKIPVKNRSGNAKSNSITSAIEKLHQKDLLPTNIRGNIEALIELRDNSIHFVNDTSITKQVQELGFACIKNYIGIVKSWGLEIDLSSYNLYLMPLAYIDEQKIVQGTLTKETTNYINLIKEKLSQEEKDSDFDIAITIDVDFKKGNSFESIGVSYSPDGIPIKLSEEQIRRRFPYTFKKLVEMCRTRYNNFKQDKSFYVAIKEIKKNDKLCHKLTLYPDNPKAQKSYYYSSNVWTELDKHYSRKKK